MRSWRAAAVASFLEDEDLAGPAATLFANRVNGVDLEVLTADELTSSLRLTSFAARKILQARDKFLQQ